MKMYLPQNLDLKSLLERYPPGFKYEIEKFMYILSLLSVIPAYNKELLDEDGYVPLKAKYLNNKVRDYKKYLQYLIDIGIIESNNHYKPRKRSKGFRYTEAYQTKNRVVEVRKFTLSKPSNFKKPKLNVRKLFPHLIKYFNESLIIDHKAAFEFIDYQLQLDLEQGVKNPYLKYNSSLVCIHKLKDHEFYHSVDNTIHRFHSNITGCKSELRNFLTYDNLSMVAVDISNSQPMISTLTFNPGFYVDDIGRAGMFGIHEINSSHHTGNATTSLEVKYPIKEIITTIMVCNNQESHDRQGIDDIQIYRDKVAQGTLYEYMAKEIKSRMGITVKNRKKLKEIMFLVMFSDNRFIGQADAMPKRIFREIFPTVYKVFSLIKRHGKANLPILLQKMEAKLILFYVVKRISHEKPAMPLYTVHDSVVCPVGNEDYVARVIIEETKACINITPQVKFEYWDPNQVPGFTPSTYTEGYQFELPMLPVADVLKGRKVSLDNR